MGGHPNHHSRHPLCPRCFFNNKNANLELLKFHREVGCPALAKGGFILKRDPAAAKKVYEEFSAKFLAGASRRKPNNQQGARRGVRGTDTDTPAPARDGDAASGPAASRVTSPVLPLPGRLLHNRPHHLPIPIDIRTSCPLTMRTTQFLMIPLS